MPEQRSKAAKTSRLKNPDSEKRFLCDLGRRAGRFGFIDDLFNDELAGASFKMQQLSCQKRRNKTVHAPGSFDTAE